jgi:hypothetical protein
MGFVLVHGGTGAYPAAPTALCFVLFQTLLQDPHYSVAIDSVSGLDPVLGSRPALDPEFNLTFRVASHGFWVRECSGHGGQVDVCPTAASSWPLA